MSGYVIYGFALVLNTFFVTLMFHSAMTAATFVSALGWIFIGSFNIYGAHHSIRGLRETARGKA